MSLADVILREPSNETLQLWIKKVPYAAFLGIEAELQEDDILFRLPGQEKLIGNPSLPSLHGGVVGGFMEQAAAFHLIAKMENPVLPKIIDFSLDYLRPARYRDTFASCVLTRQGRFIANVSIAAWQETAEEPVSLARAHFLLPDSDAQR
jgi:acyl-coenzyme A thioesterase PaaI-like protein